MRKVTISLLLIACSTIFMSTSCRQQMQEPFKLNGEAQGTYYAITYYDDQGRNLKESIDSIFKTFDLSVSVYKPESIISKFNRNDEGVVADSVFETVFKKAMEVSKHTDGAFDITVMPLVNAWGFGYTERNKIDSTVIDSLLPLIGYSKVQLRDGKLIKEDSAMMIDFNAIAQGFTCDLIGKFFSDRGITNYLIDVGGEVLAKGNKPDGSNWKVAIEKPAPDATSSREIQIVVPLRDKALATSGNYRAFIIENGRKYSHTIDPKTGFPVNHTLLSVSVIADDCMTADAYATAFMVMGLEKTKEFLEDNKDLEVFIIYDQEGKMKTWNSSGFKVNTGDI